MKRNGVDARHESNAASSQHAADDGAGAGCQMSPTAEDVRAIRQLLTDQVAAWNRGDIDGFMQAYWNSADLEFHSGDSVTRGWQAIRDHFRTRYDSREKMGALDFTDLNVTIVTQDTATATGRFELSRKESPKESGKFALDFRRIDGQWKITRDRTIGEGPDSQPGH